LLTLNTTPLVVDVALTVTFEVAYAAVNSASDAFENMFAYSVMYTLFDSRQL